MHYLDGAWADILDWGYVLAGLAVVAAALTYIERRHRRPPTGIVMPPRLAPGREWDVVMGRASNELARGPKVEALQADATVVVQAAEYAYNRLLKDVAGHYTRPSADPAPAMVPAAAELAPAEPALPDPAPEEVPAAEAPAREPAPLAA